MFRRLFKNTFYLSESLCSRHYRPNVSVFYKYSSLSKCISLSKSQTILLTNPNSCRRILSLIRIPATVQLYRINPTVCKEVRVLHTSAKRHAAPVVILAVKYLGRAVAILTGRGFRKWWKNLPPNKKQHFLNEFKKHRMKIILFTGLTMVLAALYYESHIQETPITKRKRFVALTSEQFRQVADLAFKLQQELHKETILPTSDPSYKRVGDITHRILDSNKNLQQVTDRVWSISIIDEPEQNAFVLPGGQIFVYKGMLDFCKKDDELGVILAHEIAHCVMEHGVEQLSYSHLLDFAVIVILAAIWALLPNDGIAIVTQWFFNKIVSISVSLPYSRKLETEADEVGLQLAAKACFDVRESSAFWSKMAFNEKMDGEETDIGWLSTHPAHNARAEYLDSIMEKAIQLRDQCGCPRLLVEDPRTEVAILSRAIEEQMERQKSEPRALLISVQAKETST